MQIATIETTSLNLDAVTASTGVSPIYVDLGAANTSVSSRLELSVRPSTVNEARKTRATLNVPYATVDATGVTRKSANILFSLDVVFPDIVPAAARNSAIALFQEVLTNAQVTSTMLTGYAPN